MRIIVLSCSTGGGHNACGQYIKKEFQANNIACDFVDYFSILGENISKNIEKMYLDSTKNNGGIFKTVYKLGELYSKTGITSPIYGLNKMARHKLKAFLEENKYDIAICPHLFPAMAITALKEEGYNIPLINVATDYEMIPFWEETNPDYFVIPHESLKDSFMKKEYPENILLPFGIPVASSFNNLKNNLDLPKDKDIILITSGSMGFGKIKDIVEEMLNNFTSAIIIVICGNNTDLFLELSSINKPNLIVKGFVENMNEYIEASTVVLTKPGGLTSTEVALINKPMVHIMPIPGVENHNATFFQERGLSLVSNSIEEIIINTNRILNDKKIQKEMINNQKKTLNKKSAKDLVNFVISNYK